MIGAATLLLAAQPRMGLLLAAHFGGPQALPPHSGLVYRERALVNLWQSIG